MKTIYPVSHLARLTVFTFHLELLIECYKIIIVDAHIQIKCEKIVSKALEMTSWFMHHKHIPCKKRKKSFR